MTYLSRFYCLTTTILWLGSLSSLMLSSLCETPPSPLTFLAVLSFVPTTPVRYHFFGTHHWQGKYIAIGSYSAYFLHQCIIHLQPAYIPVVIYTDQQITLLSGAWHIIGKSAYRFLKPIHIAC